MNKMAGVVLSGFLFVLPITLAAAPSQAEKPAKVFQVEVKAKPLSYNPENPWYGTGVNLGAGDQCFVRQNTSSGKSQLWTCNSVGIPANKIEYCDADGYPNSENSTNSDKFIMPHRRLMAMIGKIGPSGEPFFLGKDGHCPDGRGELFLAANDQVGSHHDNDGSLWALIDVTKCSMSK